MINQPSMSLDYLRKLEHTGNTHIGHREDVETPYRTAPESNSEPPNTLSCNSYATVVPNNNNNTLALNSKTNQIDNLWREKNVNSFTLFQVLLGTDHKYCGLQWSNYLWQGKLLNHKRLTEQNLFCSIGNINMFPMWYRVKSPADSSYPSLVQANSA